MGPNYSNPDDDALKAKLLEKLMDEMDDRVATRDLQPKVNVEETMGLGTEGHQAGQPNQPIESGKSLPNVTAESNGDGLDDDPSMDPELKDLIRAKRGGR